jgi:hypothetical protein
MTTEDRQNNEALRKLLRITQNQTRIAHTYFRLDDEAKNHIDELVLNTPVEQISELAVLDILQNSETQKHGMMLEASVFFNRNSQLSENLYYWLVSVLMDTRKFAPVMECPSAASPELQAEVLSIAAGLSLLDEADSNNTNSVYLTGTPEGYVEVQDDKLVDAMLEYPAYAPVIAKLYIERGSLDALDEALSVPLAITGGIL